MVKVTTKEGRAAILLRNKEVTMATAQQATSRHLSHNTYKSVCGINFHPKVEGERTENRKKSDRKFKQKHVSNAPGNLPGLKRCTDLVLTRPKS